MNIHRTGNVPRFILGYLVIQARRARTTYYVRQPTLTTLHKNQPLLFLSKYFAGQTSGRAMLAKSAPQSSQCESFGGYDIQNSNKETTALLTTGRTMYQWSSE